MRTFHVYILVSRAGRKDRKGTILTQVVKADGVLSAMEFASNGRHPEGGFIPGEACAGYDVLWADEPEQVIHTTAAASLFEEVER